MVEFWRELLKACVRQGMGVVLGSCSRCGTNLHFPFVFQTRGSRVAAHFSPDVSRTL